MQAPPPPSTDRTNEGGQNLRVPTEGRSEAVGLGSAEECMDLGDNMKTRRRESLRVPGYCERLGFNTEVGPLHKDEPEDGQETACRGGGGGGRGTVRVRPPSALGGLAPDQGMV